ncbi:MAG: carboxypeptidase-like regulatory domain-containing protein [Niabella sp.]
MDRYFRHCLPVFITVFTLFCNTSFSQVVILGTIVDAENKKGIPYATITASATGIATDANESGQFEIELPNEDSIAITAVGYKKIVTHSSQLKGLNILLTPMPLVLPEVFVGKKEILTIGNLRGKKVFDMNSESSSRFEMATMISVPSNVKSYRVRKIWIKGFGFNAENPVRIHLYDVGNFGQPGDDLLNEDILITADKSKDKLLEIDVYNQDIHLQNHTFFISVQWISDKLNVKQRNGSKSHVPKAPGIYGTYDIPNGITYMRSKQSKVYKWEVMTKNMRFPYDYDKIPSKLEHPYTMLAACEVEAY